MLNLTDFEHEQTIPDRFLASEEYQGQIYVVVNTTFPIYRPITHQFELYVMGEEATTIDSIEAAVNRVADCKGTEGHTLETAQIYRLVPVKRTEELEKLYEEKLEEYKKEDEELDFEELDFEELDFEELDLSGFYEKEYTSETPIIFETLITSDSKLLEIFNLNNETFDG